MVLRMSSRPWNGKNEFTAMLTLESSCKDRSRISQEKLGQHRKNCCKEKDGNKEGDATKVVIFVKEGCKCHKSIPSILRMYL